MTDPGPANGDEAGEGDDSDDQGDPLASIGQRVAARAIDWALLLGFWLLLGAATSERLDDGTLEFQRWAVLLWIGVVLVYETGFVAWRGQTPGKMIAGIELVSLSNGAHLSVGSALMRVAPVGVAMSLLGFLFPIVMVFVYFSAAFMKHTRGLLDVIAGSVVIVARSRQDRA